MALYAAFYNATRPGAPGIYNHLVRAFEGGPHSHCEIVFSNGDSASASFMDKGARFTGDGYDFPKIDFNNGKWDLVRLPDEYEAGARAYWVAHEGWSYDIRGNIRFIFPWGNRDSALKVFCSEGLLACLGVPEAWRFGVNSARAVCLRLGTEYVLTQELQNLRNPFTDVDTAVPVLTQMADA